LYVPTASQNAVLAQETPLRTLSNELWFGLAMIVHAAPDWEDSTRVCR
jgi:hypothetical protein